MRLNNKGFAITGILYGLLILFALLVGSYLTVLTARKNRLDGIVENIENEYNNKENTTSTYTLTLSKDTGVSTIYYKINGATSYSSSTSNVTLSVKYGTTYYYYGEASSGYKMSSCTSSSPCSGTMRTGVITETLKAVNGSPPYTVIINLMGSEEARGTTNDSTFTKTDVYTMGKTNIYCDNEASATIVGSTVTVTNITTDTTCNIT